MDINVRLAEDNFLLYSAKYYDNPGCFDTEEFLMDLNRFKYIKKLFKKYQETGSLKESLILNHIVILYNVFGVVPTSRMLFFRLDGYYKYLKPFLEYLNYLPKEVYNIGFHSKNINCSDIEVDEEIERVLSAL